MAELIKKVETGGHTLLCITTPPDLLPDLPDSDYDLLNLQKFVWYKDFVAFKARGDVGTYCVEIYLANNLEMHGDMERIILLPFEVPVEGTLLVTGSYGECFPFQLSPGPYEVLFETRFLNNQEIEQSDRYNYLVEEMNDTSMKFWDELRPELCIFTFITTTDEVKPKVLRGFDPKQELVLHRKSRPPGYD